MRTTGKKAQRARVCAVLTASCMLAACVSPQQRIAAREDLLAAAGFSLRPANTPERQASLHALPANRFVRQVRGDRVAYVYADPLVCGCLYVGDQQAYGRYRQDVFQRGLADEQQLTAQTYADASDWGWGPWGDPWW